MIVPAITVKDEIDKLFKAKYYTENMFYYQGGTENYPINIADSTEYGRYDWAIMDGDKVVGYMGYTIDWYSRGVYNFGLMSFDKGNPKVGVGIKDVIKLLLSYDVHRIEWKMIAGNPVERHYDFWCRKFNGAKITLRDVTKDQYGKFHDSYIYEIILDNEGRK